MRKITAAIAALVVLGACGGSDGSDGDRAAAATPVQTEPSATDATSAPTGLGPNQHQVGDLVLTVHEQIDPAPIGTISEPEPGARWIVFDLEYANPTSAMVHVMTYGLMELALSDGRRADVELLGIRDESPPDGRVPAGETLRGWVTFEVPNGVEADALLAASDFGDDPVVIELG